MTILKVDTFAGQSELETALHQHATLTVAGRPYGPGSHTLDTAGQHAVPDGRAVAHLPTALHAAALRFSATSGIPAEHIRATIVIVAPAAALSAHLDGPSADTWQDGADIRIDLGHLRPEENPLHAARYSIRLEITADEGGPVVWDDTRLARATWNLSPGGHGGGMFVVQQLNEAVKSRLGIAGEPLYHVDTRDLNETSADLSEVHVYLDPSVYSLVNDDETAGNAVLIRSIACSVLTDSAQRLVSLARNGAGPGPLLDTILRKGGLEYEDTLDSDDWAARHHSQVQSELGLTPAAKRLYSDARPDEGEYDD